MAEVQPNIESSAPAGDFFADGRVDAANANADTMLTDGGRALGGIAMRFFISPTRSGSTALLHAFANNSNVDTVFHQPVKSGYREDKNEFDYSFFEIGNDRYGHVLVAKETVGGFAGAEATFSPLPNHGDNIMVGPWMASPDEIRRIEPMILIRDPFQTWNSIHKLNEYSAGKSEYYSPFEYFVQSYKNVADFLIAAKEEGLPVHALTQEMLAADPHGIMEKLCDKWGIPYDPAMVNWSLPYPSKTWFSHEALERFENDPRFQYSKEVLQNSTGYDYRPSPTRAIEADKATIIEAELYPRYEAAKRLANIDFGTTA